MPAIDVIALRTNTPTLESRRSTGSLILSYCIALPLFGRAVFPLARDKEHITIASSFTDPQIAATYLLAAVLVIGVFTANNLFNLMTRARAAQMLLAFVAVCLASSIGSRFPLFSLWRCFEVLLLSVWVLVMIEDSSRARDPSRAIRAFYAISVAILTGVLIGLVINPSGAWSVEGDIARLTGTSGYGINPNDIGAIAAILAVGCYVRAVERRSLKYAVASAWFIVVCYVSYSRGAYIALATGLLAGSVMLGRLAQRRPIIFLAGFCAMLFVAAVTLVSQGFRDFLVFMMTRGHASENLESFGGRLQLWEFGLQIYRQHPYLGTGYGTYPEGLEGGHFHNVFIELLVTTGVMGAVIYVAFLVTLAATTRRSIGRTSPRDVTERIIAADLVTIPTVIIAANGVTAGAAYYSWDLLGLASVVVASTGLMFTGPVASTERTTPRPFSNLLR